MKVGKLGIIPVDIEITGATLLSLEEYEEYKNNIPLTKDWWWWLRSPGYYSYKATVVYCDGSSDNDGDYVDDDGNVIRPALQISNLGDVEVGDKIKFGGVIFTVISPKYALCDTVIGCGAFREDSEAADANVYEASDVKKFVDEWFANALKAAENDA